MGKMRGRTKPVFNGFDPTPRAALSCLLERSSVLPAIASEVKDPETLENFHTFLDGEFQPTSTFLALLKDEVAREVETMWDRTDVSQYPSNSESWEAVLQGTVKPQAGEKAKATVVCEAKDEDSGAAGGASGLQRKFIPPIAPEAPDQEL